MIIKQFYDEGLAHASYAIISDNKMAVIDPARNPQPYYNFAAKQQAVIIAIIETHPHADFVSSHTEIHQQTKATIYASKLLDAAYQHNTFDGGDIIELGNIKLKAINTPGHSPDSISIIVTDELGTDHAVFTGDTLLVGDVGRPDLRENGGDVISKKEELAKAMYNSTRSILMKLPGETLVYPAHGPGSLCGKNMGPELHSTIGKELRNNEALQPMDEDEFVKLLTENQPFVPKYFGFNVEINKYGAAPFEESVSQVPRQSPGSKLQKDILVIDTRPQHEFKAAHLKNAINLQDGSKFETWLGSVVAPNEPFYLIAATEKALDMVIRKSAKIGYEKQIKAALLTPEGLTETDAVFNADEFSKNPEAYTIIDIRNENEVNGEDIFKNAIRIPLPELRERVSEIPQNKPVVIHCASGYRSAIGASIVSQQINKVAVLDMGNTISRFIAEH